MNPLKLPTADNLSAVDSSLFSTILFKAIGDSADSFKFAGIASDETPDVQEDTILRKAIDLTYAKDRGYVNWDHSRQPEDQLGFLTTAEIIGPSQMGEMRKSFPDVKDTASVYIEGELYKEVPKAVQTHHLLKSAPDGRGGLGLSLDGSCARDTKTGGIVKAYVRGVAITPQPVQTRTLMKLMKSLQAYDKALGIVPSDLPGEIASLVIEGLKKSAGTDLLTRDQAVLLVLQKKPKWSYDLASKVVDYTISNRS